MCMWMILIRGEQLEFVASARYRIAFVGSARYCPTFSAGFPIHSSILLLLLASYTKVMGSVGDPCDTGQSTVEVTTGHQFMAHICIVASVQWPT